MKTLILIFSLCLMGCETTSQLPEPPDQGASYRTDYESWIVENTTKEEFCDQMTHKPEIIEGEYRDGDNKTKLEKRDE
jgi:hypothetical protein